MVPFAARPQTKNQNSDFNKTCVKERFSKVLQTGCFKVTHEKPEGYQDKTGADSTTHGNRFKGEPVNVVDPDTVIDALLTVGDDEWSVATQIWKELKKLLKSSSDSMKHYLQNAFNVKEFHPLLTAFNGEDGCTLAELNEIFKQCNKDSDEDMFKKERNADLNAVDANRNAALLCPGPTSRPPHPGPTY
eukprot:14294933-Ditylum_brightwellii.AAC.1